MDQMIINIIGAGIMAGLGWWARTLWDRIEALSEKLATFQVKVAGEYVSNERMNATLGEMKADLRYIRQRLDENPNRRASDPRP